MGPWQTLGSAFQAGLGLRPPSAPHLLWTHSALVPVGQALGTHLCNPHASPALPSPTLVDKKTNACPQRSSDNVTYRVSSRAAITVQIPHSLAAPRSQGSHLALPWTLLFSLLIYVWPEIPIIPSRAETRVCLFLQGPAWYLIHSGPGERRQYSKSLTTCRTRALAIQNGHWSKGSC